MKEWERGADTDEDREETTDRRLADTVRFVARSVQQNRLFGVLVWLALLVCGSVFISGFPTTYQATTTIYVSSSGSITAALTGGRKPSDDASAHGLNETVLKQDNLLSLVREAKLVENHARTRTWLLRLRDRILEFVRGPIGTTELERVLVRVLRSRLTPSFEPPTTIHLDVEWHDPHLTLTLANLAERNFRTSRKTDELAAIDRATAILEQQVKKTDEAIKRASIALREAVVEKSQTGDGMKGAPDDPSVVLARMNLGSAEQKARELRGRLDAARMERATAEAEFDNRYQVVEPAELPLLPKRPRKSLMLAWLFLVAFPLAIVACVARQLERERTPACPLDEDTELFAAESSALQPARNATEGPGRLSADSLSRPRHITVRAFLAYPSEPPALAETMRNAVRKLNEARALEVQGWEDLRVGGKFIVEAIRRAIDASELVIAELTDLNANVLFEVGYAVAKRKRIWLLTDRTRMNNAARSRAFSSLGYTPYANSDEIVSSLARERPHEDPDDQLHARLLPASAVLGSSSLLYLKSEHATEASIHVTQLLQQSAFDVRADDPPGGRSSLDWYGAQVSWADTVIWHLTGQRQTERHALHAFAVGLAVGLDKRVLILSEGSLLAPLDYRHLVRQYETAADAHAHLTGWLKAY